jgi:hypothetical protein
MATNFPGSLDTFVNPASGNTLDSPSHSLQHSDINDAVEAIETKLGVGTATPGTATAYFPLVAGTAGATSWTQLTAAGISSGTATSGQLLRADGSGAAAWATPTTPGLVLLNTTSFTAVSSQPINSVFSASYRNYRILVTYTAASTDLQVNLRLRVGGVSNSTASSYESQGSSSISTTLSNFRDVQSYLYISEIKGIYGDIASSTLDIMNPFETQKTKFHGQMARVNSASAFGSISYNAYHNQAVSYDGIEILTSTGNVTGVVSIYGYNI